MRDFVSDKPKNKVNTLRARRRYRNPLRVGLNFFVIYMCRFMPSFRLKNFFYRMIGIKVGRNVSVGFGVVFDIFFPELITIGDNCVLGFESVILTHEFLVDEFRKGAVVIGSDVLVGARSVILPGVSVGDGSKISALSLVNRSILPGSFFGGVPARNLKDER